MNNIENGMKVPQKNNSSKKKITKRDIALLKALFFILVAIVIASFLVNWVQSIFAEKPEDELALETSGSEVSSSLVESNIDMYFTNSLMAGRPMPSAIPEPSPAPAKDITGLPVYQYGSMVTVGNRGYEYYKFDNELALQYQNRINQNIVGIDSDVDIYTMIMPTSVDVMLPLSFLEENASLTSDQHKTIQYIASGLDSRITNIDVYPTLKAYCDQKIYFDTDSRITSLGAYYAYTAWLGTKRWTIVDVLSYNKKSIDGFVGNIGVFIGSEEVSNPETIDYYIPNADLTLSNGDPLFPDVSENSSFDKFSVFLGGSREITQIVNKSLNDQSAIVIVGDSMANPVVPFISQDYQNTYFVDYRYFDGSIQDIIDEAKADELLYITSIMATNTESLINAID